MIRCANRLPRAVRVTVAGRVGEVGDGRWEARSPFMTEKPQGVFTPCERAPSNTFNDRGHGQPSFCSPHCNGSPLVRAMGKCRQATVSLKGGLEAEDVRVFGHVVRRSGSSAIPLSGVVVVT